MPIAVHLDHARELDTVRQALECGINSVMFDGSALDYEENVAKTTEVVKMARDYGATAEGEVGIVPHEIGQLKQSDMTDPLKAAEFAERTGVDFLAVSLGSVHGIKTGMDAITGSIVKRMRLFGSSNKACVSAKTGG